MDCSDPLPGFRKITYQICEKIQFFHFLGQKLMLGYMLPGVWVFDVENVFLIYIFYKTLLSLFEQVF